MPNVTAVSIKTSDGAAKSGPGVVYWVAVSAGATGGAFQLNDSTDDSGTDMLNITVAATTTQFFDFTGAVINFGTGIYVDVPGTNLTVNVGYA
jgi:hypothetical protein|tara:strand:+ start:204 stop:482 length:279 start_codon:yes stop_codon:yes gene_type:complete